MNIKALITSLVVLGSTSVAMASPSVSFKSSTNSSFEVRGRVSHQARPQVRDHRNHRIDHRADYYRPRPTYVEPTLLSAPLSFGTTEYRKDVIPMTDQRFRKLIIEGNTGTTFVHEIRVQFTDLQWQMITLNRTLRAGEELTLSLDGNKSLKRVLVYRADGDAAHNLNQAQRGTFLVSAL